jgi:hypothetical protein
VIRQLYSWAAPLVLVAVLGGCASAFTSIQRDADGRYVITGVEAPGPTGFVWMGYYDPKTKTLTVREKLPR